MDLDYGFICEGYDLDTTSLNSRIASRMKGKYCLTDAQLVEIAKDINAEFPQFQPNFIYNMIKEVFKNA